MPDPTMFATPTELGDLLGITIAEDDSRATLLLETATALLQNEANQHFFLVENDAITLQGVWAPEIWLPQRPVLAIADIKVNGLEIVTGGYTFSSSGQLYRGRLPLGNAPEWDELDFPGGALPGGASWGGPQSTVTVTYSHGFVVIPLDLRSACLSASVRAYGNPAGFQHETIGTYAYTTAVGSPAGVMLTDDEKMIAQRYARRTMSMQVSN